MRRLSGIVLLAVPACLAGCQIVTHNQGEMGIRWGTEVTFFSRSAQTAPEPATVKFSVDDRIMGPPSPQVPETAAANPPRT